MLPGAVAVFLLNGLHALPAVAHETAKGGRKRHTVPKAAYDAAKENMAKAPWWQKMSPFSLEPNAIEPVKTEDGSTVYIVDGIVADQGPNYILAKRLQHWRAILEWSRGHTISSRFRIRCCASCAPNDAPRAARARERQPEVCERFDFP